MEGTQLPWPGGSDNKINEERTQLWANCCTWTWEGLDPTRLSQAALLLASGENLCDWPSICP